MRKKTEQQKAFYRSNEWRKCRDAYYKKRHGLCERCLERGVMSAGEIVHHKTHLDALNVYDPDVALSEKNLELLCRTCHAVEHRERDQRYRVDEAGRIIAE